MDNHTAEILPTHTRHESSSNHSLNTLRAFTGNPSRSAPHTFPMMHPHVRTGSHVADVKPRLTKEQHDILETHFRGQAKPSTNVKKGFAESLNVPLDKINNWFQNRRAKVKQEAKKAQNQEALMQQNAQNYAMQQQQQSQPQVQQPSHLHPQAPQQMPIPNPSSYFATNGSMGSATRATDSSQPSLEGLTAQFNLGQGDFGPPGLGSISEAPGSNAFNQMQILQSLNAAGYQFTGHQQNHFDNIESGSFSSSMSGNGNNPFLSSLNIPTSQFGDSFDFSNFGTGPSNMQSVDSPGSYLGNPFAPQSGSGAHPSASVTSLPIFDDDSDAQDELFNPSFAFRPHAHGLPHRHVASASLTSLPTFGGGQSGLYQQSNHSSQVIISGPDNSFSFGDLEPPNPPFAQEAFSRRSSSTSNLADTMQGVGIESQSPSESGSFKQSLHGTGLGARRQRRPAPLGSSATRSASYTPGMSGSPNSSTPNLNAEQNLRRIRSSQGMNGGRVQKNSSGSAQHSPVTLAFGQAASSPKFARQAAGLVSGVSTPGANGANGAIPPTPLTPSENTRFPSWQTSGEIKPQPSLADTSSPPDSLGLTFSTTDSTASDHPDVKGASPKTPADANVPGHHLGSLGSNSTYRDTPPQSAPATQQTFSQPMFMPQTQQPVNDYLVPNDFALNQMRRPSLPDHAGNAQYDSQVQQYGLQNFNPNAGELPMGYSVQYPNMNSYSPVMFSMDPAPSMSSGVAASQSETTAFADNLVVHEYAPPNSAGGKSEPRRQPDQPKTFVFANHGPNDFQPTS